MGSDNYDQQVARLNRDYKYGGWMVKGSFIFLVPLILTVWTGAWGLAIILILLTAVTWWIGVRKRDEGRERLEELGELHK